MLESNFKILQKILSLCSFLKFTFFQEEVFHSKVLLVKTVEIKFLSLVLRPWFLPKRLSFAKREREREKDGGEAVFGFVYGKKFGNFPRRGTSGIIATGECSKRIVSALTVDATTVINPFKESLAAFKRSTARYRCWTEQSVTEKIIVGSYADNQ